MVDRQYGFGHYRAGSDLNPHGADLTIRAAVQADAATIRRIVRRAGINPLGLDWRRFVVAEADGQIVATGQIKPHRDGTRELASIATVPSYRNLGIASRVVRTLLAGETGPVYLICEGHRETFYIRFGFRSLPPAEMPLILGWYHRLARWLGPVIWLATRQTFRLCVMKRDPETVLS